MVFATCARDETLSGYGAADKVWQLIEMDGRAVSARVTLPFPKEGLLAGQAPCNAYRGQQTAPYPWFGVEALISTRAACPELDVETTYLKALSEMTLAEVAGDTLILSNDDGAELVFKAEE